MEKIQVTVSPDGVYSCEIGVSVEEWEEILSDPTVTLSGYKTALLAFYNAPGHTSTCKTLGQQIYGDNNAGQKFNSWITNFGEAVIRHLNRFQIYGSDGKKSFWTVAMGKGGENDMGWFEWTLRPEIVQAIDNLGWNKHYTWIPFYMEMADKLLQFKDNRAPLLDIVYQLDDSFVAYIKDTDGSPVPDIDPFTVFGIFNRGLTEGNRLAICSHFKNALGIEADLPTDFDGVPVLNAQKAVYFWRENISTDIQPLWEVFDSALKGDESSLATEFDLVQKNRGVKWNLTMGLFWARPYDYISLDSCNREYLPTIGIENFKENELNAQNYFKLLNNVKKKIAVKSIEEKDIPEISYRAWLSSNKQSDRTYWLVGHQISGKTQLTRFIEDSIWEGVFGENSSADLKMLALVKSIQKGDVLIVKSTYTKGRNHDQGVLRVKAVGVVTDDIQTTSKDGWATCTCKVQYHSVTDRDFEETALTSYRKTIHKGDAKAKSVIEYANSVLGETPLPVSVPQPQSKYKQQIDLLKANYNLVLTGAPGTGKTYMAQQMAKDMGCSDEETCFVQFHPSYDYTDFVEGLRPVEKEDGQIGFERRDGVFKEFCKKAIRNLADSKKSVGDLTKEMSWEERLQQFVEDAIDNGTRYKLLNGNEFTIADMEGRTITVNNENNEKTSRVRVNADEIIELLSNDVALDIVRDIRNYFKRKFGTQPDSYTFVLTKAIRKMQQKKPAVEASKVHIKTFIFIIDEINRGEASKIFGELFYAIDPGYRGKTDSHLKTQYQNLVPASDVFANGFYVPENVYILATMNDIDRSVESMDFAMRRRFTWQEITPEMTESMLDELPCADEAKDVLHRLNAAITKADGLGAAFQIGPSYFLKLKEYGGDFDKLWKLNLEPLLREYLRGFRKSDDMLKEFRKAYFFETASPTTDDSIEVIDSEN